MGDGERYAGRGRERIGGLPTHEDGRQAEMAVGDIPKVAYAVVSGLDIEK